MTRRNLRKWAEAKERRAQQAPPRGHWSYGPYGTGTPIFFEDPPFGTYVAPMVWLPMEPVPTNGPPYTHTFSWPLFKYGDDGKLLPPKIQPTMTGSLRDWLNEDG